VPSVEILTARDKPGGVEELNYGEHPFVFLFGTANLTLCVWYEGETWACKGRFGAHGNIVSYLRVEAEPASGLCEGAGSFSPRRLDVCPSLPDETEDG
jgi:hypothetical protein